MKFLKYFVITIVALVLIFFLIGMIKPAVNYGHEITVDKPLEEAWGVTQDDDKYAEWLDGFQSMELISGERNKVGCQYKVIVNPGEGQPDFEMIETLNAIKLYEFVDMTFTSDFMDFEQIMTFSEKDGKTTVKTDSKVLGKGAVMRSMFALMEGLSGAFQAQEEKNMEALKKVIEENTTQYSTTP